MQKVKTWVCNNLKTSVFLLIVSILTIYVYKCYTDPYFYKTELYSRLKICSVLSSYIPNGSTREHVERILINSDGARIEQNKPNSKGLDVGSVIYNLDPWVINSNDSSYMYVWYDKNNRVIGLTGTHCSYDRYPKSRKEYLDQLLKIRGEQ